MKRTLTFILLLFGFFCTQVAFAQFIWPVGGEITDAPGSPREGGSSHQGVDIAVPVGTPVAAAAGGTVRVGRSGRGGLEVVIEHPDGTATLYSHLLSANVKNGQQVRAGETIAASGGAAGHPNSGSSRGPHLHFQIFPPGGSNTIHTVNGQIWSVAAGVRIGASVSKGSSIGVGGPAATNPAGNGQPNNGGAATPPPPTDEEVRAEAAKQCPRLPSDEELSRIDIEVLPRGAKTREDAIRIVKEQHEKCIQDKTAEARKRLEDRNRVPVSDEITNAARKSCEGNPFLNARNSVPFEPEEKKKERFEQCVADEVNKIREAEGKKVRLGKISTGVPEQLQLENILPTPEAWMAETNSLLDEYKIPDHAQNLGIALLFAGFVYSLTSLMRAHRSDELFLLFGRLIIAAGLLMAAPVIRSGSETVWKGAYDVMKANVVKPATDDLQKGLNDLYPLLTSLTSIAVASKFVAALIPDVPIVDAAEEGVTAVGDLSQQSARGLFGAMLALGGLYGVYFLAIYGSGMIMILGATLVPILMAFLVIPGMASWFSKWFAMMATSFFMVIVFPLLFAVIVSLGVNKPMERVNKELSGVQQTAQDFVRTLNSMPDVNIQNTWALGDWAKDAIGQMTEISSKLILVAVPLTLSLVLLIISIGASMYLMQQLPGILSGFIGGSAGSAASVGGGAGAAFAGGLAAVSNYAGSRGSQTQKAISGPVRGAIGAKKFADKVIANTPTKDGDKKGDSKKDGKDSSKKDSAPPGGSKDKSTSGDSGKDKSSGSPLPNGGSREQTSSSSPNGGGDNSSTKQATNTANPSGDNSSSPSSSSTSPTALTSPSTSETSNSTAASSSTNGSNSNTSSDNQTSPQPASGTSAANQSSSSSGKLSDSTQTNSTVKQNQSSNNSSATNTTQNTPSNSAKSSVNSSTQPASSSHSTTSHSSRDNGPTIDVEARPS